MNEIEIITINDLLKIPPDKFDEFIKGFCEAIRATKRTHDLIVSMVEASGSAIKAGDIVLPRIIWKDDGKKDITININTHGTVKP
jgi:hypothetical protein